MMSAVSGFITRRAPARVGRSTFTRFWCSVSAVTRPQRLRVIRKTSKPKINSGPREPEGLPLRSAERRGGSSQQTRPTAMIIPT